MKKIVVIGGGIVGLAVSREILTRRPDLEVVTLEKESQIGTHQTGHNSGVIHSGIYYAPHSEKALTCREGTKLLQEFCNQHQIERRVCGKVIVATRPEEIPRLERLYNQGIANGISRLRMISQEELSQIEPAVTGLKALHLPDVSLVDFQKVGKALKQEMEGRGGRVELLQKVLKVHFSKSRVEIETDRQSYSADYLVNCAGLYSDWIARLAGCDVPVRIIPFRGEYFYLAPEIAKKIRGLVYPVPDPRFPFLGVHLTPTLDGKVTAGPNAVLALAREGYSWKIFKTGEVMDYLTYSGFWRMAVKYWRTGIFEMTRSLIKPFYAASVRNFLPSLETSDLLSGSSGVRAQAVNPKGEFIHDFLYVQQPQATHLLNAPSPAATASLAIARRVIGLLPL